LRKNAKGGKGEEGRGYVKKRGNGKKPLWEGRKKNGKTNGSRTKSLSHESENSEGTDKKTGRNQRGA